MVRLFKHYVPHAVLLLGLVDCALLFLASNLAWTLRASQVGMEPGALSDEIIRSSKTFRIAIDRDLVPNP